MGAATATVPTNHELQLVMEVEVETTARGDVDVEAGL